MRRKDREVTEPDRIEEIICRCSCCRIGFLDETEIYIVPLNFGYEKRAGKHIFYFHGAKAGRKYELAVKNPKVGFELDTGFVLKSAEEACGHSAAYQSVIGNGVIEIVKEADEKQQGLQLLMEHYTGKCNWKIKKDNLEYTAVFKLTATQISVKEHR